MESTKSVNQNTVTVGGSLQREFQPDLETQKEKSRSSRVEIRKGNRRREEGRGAKRDGWWGKSLKVRG